MSVDTVNVALSAVTRRMRNSNPGDYSPEGLAKLLSIAECMRYELMRGNILGFNLYVDSVLAREPDAADFLLEELFEELGIVFREELQAKLDEM